MLVNGKWDADWTPLSLKEKDGSFRRQVSSFRNWITPDGSPGPTGTGGFKAEAGRYHLYVALICPWACRTLIARKLKGLDDLISVSVVSPKMTDQSWAFGGFDGADEDPLNGARYLHEIYTKADPTYTGRATVPVLWDKKTGTIVNNESADIIRMFNSAFEGLTGPTINLYPNEHTEEIEALNKDIYETLNNGVYKAGFAREQAPYEEAVTGVFKTLDQLEERLADGRHYLFGDQFTETDIRLFVTLVRFDAAYHGLFKCNIRRLADYPNLSGYTQRVHDLPGVAETVNIMHIKTGYYTIKALNPSCVVPLGPDRLF